MSSEQLIRQILQGDEQATLLPGIELSDVIDDLDAAALGRLTADAIRLGLREDLNELQRKAHSLLTSTRARDTAQFDTTSASNAAEAMIAVVIAKQNTDESLRWGPAAVAKVIVNPKVEISKQLKKSLVKLLSFRKDHNILTFALSAVAGNPLPPNTWVVGYRTIDDPPFQEDTYFLPAQLQILNNLSSDQPHLCIQMAMRMERSFYEPEDEVAELPDAMLFSQTPQFAEFARPALEFAAEHAEKIHSGDIAFKADKALPGVDRASLQRFVSVALLANEPWLPPLLHTLLTKLSVSPKPSAKSAPSQSATYSIAVAIAAHPTVATWLSLKQASTNTKHAALKKRLERRCKLAEQKLASSDDFLRTWPTQLDIPRALNKGLKRAFELMLISGDSLAAQEFNALLENTGLAKLATSLVWVVNHSTEHRNTFHLTTRKKQLVLVDRSAAEISLDKEDKIQLLHPIESEIEELDYWRTWAIDKKIKQPFNQLFRETYLIDEKTISHNVSTNFAGFRIDAATLIGLSNSVGWQLSKYDGFKITLGRYQFVLYCGELYPGYHGVIDSGPLKAHSKNEPIAWADLPPRIASEAYRANDLLVSVAAFAVKKPVANPVGPATEVPANDNDEPSILELLNIDESEQPGFTSANSRVDLLKRLYPNNAQSGKPYIEGRYLCVQDVRIHCATGRASRLGETLEYAPKKGAVALPYPDKILERIIKTVNSIQTG